MSDDITITREELVHLCRPNSGGKDAEWHSKLLMMKLGRCASVDHGERCQQWEGHPGRHIHQAISFFVSWENEPEEET